MDMREQAHKSQIEFIINHINKFYTFLLCGIPRTLADRRAQFLCRVLLWYEIAA